MREQGTFPRSTQQACGQESGLGWHRLGDTAPDYMHTALVPQRGAAVMYLIRSDSFQQGRARTHQPSQLLHSQTRPVEPGPTHSAATAGPHGYGEQGPGHGGVTRSYVAWRHASLEQRAN